LVLFVVGNGPFREGSFGAVWEEGWGGRGREREAKEDGQCRNEFETTHWDATQQIETRAAFQHAQLQEARATHVLRRREGSPWGFRLAGKLFVHLMKAGVITKRRQENLTSSSENFIKIPYTMST